jgi:hypothetical protein
VTTVGRPVPAYGFAHHLLIRRSTDKKQLAGGCVDFEYAYFLVHHRRDAALGEAVCRAGVRSFPNLWARQSHPRVDELDDTRTCTGSPLRISFEPLILSGPTRNHL